MTTEEYNKYDRIIAQTVESIGKRGIGTGDIYLKEVDLDLESHLYFLNIMKIFSDILGINVYVKTSFFQFRKMQKLMKPFDRLQRTKEKDKDYISLTQLVSEIEQELEVGALTFSLIYCLYYKRRK